MRFLAFFFIVILSSCGCPGIPTKKCLDPVERGLWVKTVDVEPISAELINYAVKLRHEFGLRFEDSNIYYDEFVDRIRIIFSTQAILELKEGRELAVDVMEGLLERLNSNGAIASQFEFGEVLPEHIELYLAFESYFNTYVDQEYIGWISIYDGLAHYYSATLKYPYSDYWHGRTEPYYKSLEYVTYEREAESAYDTFYTPNEGTGPAYDILIE